MIYATLNELDCLNPKRASHTALTLVSVMKNELYFLPHFFEHYRNMGVQQFAVLDDKSDDGTREFLLDQPDCIVYKSAYSFGDKPFSHRKDRPFTDIRMAQVWRSLLLSRHSADRWALCLDADEFLRLPEGRDLSSVIAAAEKDEAKAVVAVMLDLYPKSISDIQKEQVFDSRDEWFFDGVPHLRLCTDESRLNRPERLYEGARDRLIRKHLPDPFSWRVLAKKLLKRPIKRKSTEIVKVPLMFWSSDSFFTNSHWPQIPVSSKLLLPLCHYKFTWDLYRRVKQALESGAYWRGSVEYQGLSLLLARMAEAKADFCCEHSVRAGEFDRFERTGNAAC